MQRARLALLICFLLALAACSLISTPSDEQPLRAEYARKAATLTQANLYTRTQLINVGVGVVSQILPGWHLVGMFVDVAVLAYYFDELIYGTGAIIARDKACPTLLEQIDYWNVMSAWLGNVRTSKEFENVMNIAGTVAVAGLSSSEKTRKVFLAVTKAYGSKLLGAKLAGIIVAKLAAKGVAGVVPILGPIVAGAINWYILDRMNDAAISYYQVKANFVCNRPDP